MDILKVLEQNNLSYELTPVSLRELIYLRESPCPIYTYSNGRFEKIIEPLTPLDKNHLHALVSKNIAQLFVKLDDLKIIHQLNQDKMLKKMRAISIGDVWKNLQTATNLLTIQLGQIIKNPHDKGALQAHYQSLKNIANVLFEHPHLIPKLYQYVTLLPIHYTISHPLLSSLFLLGLLEHEQLIYQKEKENLFIISYLKDIGMSLIPQELYNKKKPSDKEKEILYKHSHFSKTILEDSVPLSLLSLEMIETHHLTSQLIAHNESEAYKIEGVGHILIHSSDVLIAMIRPRPFRKEDSVYNSLKFIKGMMEKDYGQEFKILVNFVQTFFK